MVLGIGICGSPSTKSQSYVIAPCMSILCSFSLLLAEFCLQNSKSDLLDNKRLRPSKRSLYGQRDSGKWEVDLGYGRQRQGQQEWWWQAAQTLSSLRPWVSRGTQHDLL